MESDMEDLSISNLNELIKQNRNADFKIIVLSVSRSDLLNIGGKTLMHTAAAQSNIDIIVFLSVAGFDIDAINTLGQTPLHVALFNSNFQAVQLFLSLDADILVGNSGGVSTLHMCFRKDNQVPDYIISCFLQRLKRSGLSAQRMADVLEEVGCSVLQALEIDDTEIIGIMLDRRTSMHYGESRILLQRALTSGYPDSIRALVQRGPESNDRLEIFLDQVIDRSKDPKMKCYLKRLVDWDAMGKNLIGKATRAFRMQNEDDMRVYLEIGVDVYARRKYGWELLVGLFRNESVDFKKIVKNRQFDVNGLDTAGFSALHVAASSKNKAGMVYLLDNGADSNVKNYQGQTPLFDCYDDELIELLLEAGADVQIVTNNRETILHYTYHDRIIAELCFLEVRGLLKRQLEIDIRSNTSSILAPRLREHRSDIEWMRNCYFSESVSLFTVLIGEVEKTARYVKSEHDVAAILEAVCCERQLQPIYVSMLKKNLEKAVKMKELRFRAAAFLSDVMRIDSLEHLVIERIVGLLTYQDLSVLGKVNVEE